MPLSGPAIATVAILTFLPAWNSYLWPLMVVQTEELRPVMVGVQYFFQLNVSWGEVMAYASLITLPVVGLFIVAVALARLALEGDLDHLQGFSRIDLVMPIVLGFLEPLGL